MLSAERQLLQALPKLVQASASEELQTAFQNHLEETESQVARLKQGFDLLGHAARARKCEAMAGPIEEAKSLLEEQAAENVQEALLIAAAQKVAHSEIATYGT